ncbi:LacI family DNA-binding transcriptional regulator [Streptomyces sp. HPF1205]|uniref:LacI family DNA-binding transcriptional regulator n=1 Tax=Streptomyces sp. HPF1205 TaxID=2873262 RepID=UPI001CED2CF9|nr:LacI family DNA-binding transcriptional regulator [Streptomyces sp. HPF1205]
MTAPAGRRTGRRITIRDVARKAGVSSAAVSLALNNRPGVSESTRTRIMGVAKQLGWTPNTAAVSLSAARVHTVGLVLARPAPMLGREPFYMDFIAGVEAVLHERGYSLLLRLVDSVQEETEVHREWWQGRRVDGSLLVDLQTADPRIEELSRAGLPAVVVGHPSLAGPFPAVWTDDAVAMTEATRYLAALGHRSIARVGGPSALGHCAIRTEAFLSAAAELGIEDAKVVTTDFSGDGGSRATRSLLLSANRPTAIIYDNDIMAVAGLGVATEMRVRVPQDLSLLAWDDSQLCALVRPRLSAMSHDVFGFGAQCARLLFEVLGKREAVSEPAPGPVLVPRESTAPPTA